MVRDFGYACLAAALIAPSCGRGRPLSRPMRVTSALPKSAPAGLELGTQAHPVLLYLTSNVTVSFSEDLDPLSVTTDTVRIVKVTPNGPQTVKVARRRIGTRSVTLEPEWPVSADLSDGSFQPGQLYKLEVAGFPLTNTVASKTGLPVGGQFVRYYRAVDREVSDPGPLLPVGLPSDPFELTVRFLRMASDMRTVLLHFSLPVDPRTVSPESFVLMHTDTIPIESTRVLSVRRPIFHPAETPGGAQGMAWSYPSSTVEIRLADGFPLRPDARFGVDLRPPGKETHWIRDYRGRHITQRQRIVTGTISHGTKVELVRLHVEGNDLVDGSARPVEFQRVGQNLNFEGRDGRLQVLARRDAGRGNLGVFHPKRSMTLSPWGPFGTNEIRISGPRFEFSEIYIPAGVTVTLKATEPVELLSTGRIRIDGELRLATVYAAEKGDFESPTSAAYLRRVLESKFGCRLVAAADITLRGAIRHALPDAYGHRPALVLWGRSLSLHGPLPARTIRAREPGRVAGGAVQTGFPMAMVMPQGYPEGHRATAAAWTPWVRLPADFSGSTISARFDGLKGDSMRVFLQVASPDPIDPSQPYLDPAGLPEPQELPLKQPIEVSGRVHVRFLLRAKVIGGRTPLPSVRALVVLGG
jgi:hypothetical protein